MASHNPRLDQGYVLFTLVFLSLLSLPSEAQKSRKKTLPPEPSITTETTVVKTVHDTVYIREKGSSESSTSSSSLRPYDHTIGLHAALYAAEVLGSNPYIYGTYDLYPLPLYPLFVELTLGIGFAQSDFSTDVIGARRYNRNMLIATEVLGGFNLGTPKETKGISGGLYPHLLIGVAGLYQGGIPVIHQGSEANVAIVFGFGQRIAFPWEKKMGVWAVAYGVRDQIYTQKIEGNPSLTQNLIVHLGLLRYY